MGVGDRVRDRIGTVGARLTGWARTRARRHRWLDRLVRAGRRYQEVRGDHLAAAITYFSFLSLFPLALLAMSVAGFVLLDNPDLLVRLQRAITRAVPGQVGDTLVDVVNGAVNARGTLGVVGVLGTLYAGLGWAGNLRTAGQAVWRVSDERSFPRRKLGDLLVLVGLGLAALVSIGLTTAGTVATNRLVGALGLRDVTGVGVLARVCGVAVATAGDVVAFAWVFARLPGHRMGYRRVASGAVFAAIGFELLKVLGAYYARRVSESPATGVFGNAIGLLVWLNLFARFLLFVMAWTAVREEARGTDGGSEPVEVRVELGPVVPPTPPAEQAAERGQHHHPAQHRGPQRSPRAARRSGPRRRRPR